MDGETYYATTRDIMNKLPESVRPEKYLSPNEVITTVNGARNELFMVYDKLHDIVLTHEATIRKRWLKKTRVKRQALLRDAYPAIPESHAPEVKAYIAEHFKGATRNREDFLLPFANIEDLCSDSGAKFLSLLYYRSRYFPSEFAQFDQSMAHFAIVSLSVKRVYAQGSSIICYGDRETYGKLVGCDEHNEFGGKQLERRGDAFYIGEGLIVFETQQKLLTLLLRAVEKLLWDIDITSTPLLSSPGEILPPPQIPIPFEMDYGWESIARQHNLRGYLGPPGFSLASLSTLVESQYELSVNHLVDLRTDPAYLAEQLQLHVAHRLEAMTIGARPSQALINDRATMFLLTGAVSDFTYWHLAKQAVERAFRASENMDNAIERGKSLPALYQDALQDTQAVLLRMDQKEKSRYPQILCSSPPLRRFFVVNYTDTHSFSQSTIQSLPVLEGDRLFGILITLLNEEQIHLWQLTRLYDELDGILASSQAERDRISPLLSNSLSQRGAVNDVTAMIERHRPKVDAESSDQAEARLDRMSQGLINDFETSGRKPLRLESVAFPVSRFSYPKGPKTEEWARGCEAVDIAMSTFWARAEHQIRILAGDPVADLMQKILRPHLDPREIWTNLVQKKAPPKPQPVRNIPVVDIRSAPVPEDVRSRKVKTKRRGEPSTMDRNEPLVSAMPDVAPAATDIIAVSARTFRTLRTLFRCASNDQLHQQQGTVAWTEVLHAFSQLGFEIIKTRGSAWRFSKGGKNGGSFTEHAPHPEPELNFWRARRLGRRIARRFDWDGESFVLTDCTDKPVDE